jgi:hypothetical protein
MSCAIPPEPAASAITWMAPRGTPLAASAAAIACARAKPSVTACCCDAGSDELASPRPSASITWFPRFAARALSAGNESDGTEDEAGGNWISTVVAGLDAGWDTTARGAAEAAVLTAGGPGETAADGALTAALAAGGGAAGGADTPGNAGGGGGAVGTWGCGLTSPGGTCVTVAMLGSGALCTALTGAFWGGGGAPATFCGVPAEAGGADAVAGAGGADGVAVAGGADGMAGAGGAVAAGRLAEAAGAPAGGGGPGGGVVPMPKRSGDAVGEEGSASGAAAAKC